MDPYVKMVLESAQEGMEKAVQHLDVELLKIRAGKANPVMLQGIMVEYYGAPTPLNQVASVSSPEPRMLVVQPFDKSALRNIEKAIVEANLGFNPQNDGIIIRIPVPALNEERRKALVKQAKAEGENAKIAIRNVRRDHNDQVKKLKDDGVSEDNVKDGESEVQNLTNKYSSMVDDVLKKKESEIMTI